MKIKLDAPFSGTVEIILQATADDVLELFNGVSGPLEFKVQGKSDAKKSRAFVKIKMSEEEQRTLRRMIRGGL